MALQDHFRPPLSVRRYWHAFHNAWATYIAAHLNQRLPDRYFAAPNVQFGVQIDVATFEESGEESRGSVLPLVPGGSSPAWAPPAPALSVPIAVVTDSVEVMIFGTEGGPTLAGAIELVSPSNKDRPASRDALVSKCAAYLQQGVGLVIVDVVTDRRADLHAELLARLSSSSRPLNSDLYAVAYRPVQRNGDTTLDIWPETLAIGRPLPTLPLWLRGGISLPVDLDATYERTCQEQRVMANGA